jgi:hypothetical protein
MIHLVDLLGTLLVGLAIALGLLGIVITALPGLLLIWAAVAVWALLEQSLLGWLVLVLATALAGGGQVVKYLIPGRRLRLAGIPLRSLLVGGLLSLIGFFVIPVVGFILGFVAGIYLSERWRLGTHTLAWPSTIEALKAAGLSMLIELLAGLGIAGAWLLAVLILA